MLAQEIGLQPAVLVTRFGQHGSHFQQIDRHQSGPHDDPEALGVFPGQVQTAVADGQGRCRHAKMHGPAHELQTFTMFRRHILVDIKVRDLRSDSNRMFRSIEGADGTDSTPSGHARRPESLLADSVGSHHSQARNHDSAHR